MIRRYLVRAARIQFKLAGRPLDDRQEMWIGIEIDSDEPLDLEQISRRTGRDLIPADGMTEDELRSCGVMKFDRVGA